MSPCAWPRNSCPTVRRSAACNCRSACPRAPRCCCFRPRTKRRLPLDVAAGDYTLFYEVCLSREVFYVLTLVREAIPHASARKSDGWGMEKDKPLVPGVF